MSRIRFAILFGLLFTNQLGAQQDQPLETTSVADSAFAKCIKENAQKKGWQTTHQVISLDCNGKGIKQIDELSLFINIERASFFRNRIETASIQGFPKLKHLNLANNALKQVNIEAVPALEELYLFRNQLKDFEALGLNRLNKLKIEENRLTSIKLEDLGELKKAYIYDNKLETIDLSKNLPSLQFVDVRINPMPDEVYDYLDTIEGVTIPHDGNAEDWE